MSEDSGKSNKGVAQSPLKINDAGFLRSGKLRVKSSSLSSLSSTDTLISVGTEMKLLEGDSPPKNTKNPQKQQQTPNDNMQSGHVVQPSSHPADTVAKKSVLEVVVDLSNQAKAPDIADNDAVSMDTSEIESDSQIDDAPKHVKNYATRQEDIHSLLKDPKFVRRYKLPKGLNKTFKKQLQEGAHYEAIKPELILKHWNSKPTLPSETEKAANPSGKRSREKDITPPTRKAEKKKQKLNSYRDKVASIKAAILHVEHPKCTLTEDQVDHLRFIILEKLDLIPVDGPQVRFIACHRKPGWLQVDCADDISSKWLCETIEQLQFWDSIKLRTLLGEEVPKTRICNIRIPDKTPGEPLDDETVIKRLSASNRSLGCQSWKRIGMEESGQRFHLWTFTMDESSFKELEKINMAPYFGYGTLEMWECSTRGRTRPRSRSRSRPRSHSRESSKETNLKPSLKQKQPHEGQKNVSAEVEKNRTVARENRATAQRPRVSFAPSTSRVHADQDQRGKQGSLRGWLKSKDKPPKNQHKKQ